MSYDQLHSVNATSQMIEVALRSATTGQLLTGVAYGGVTARYVREGAASQTTVSVVTMTQGTFASGGWIETGIAGVYQFGIPDAALASGAKAVTLVFSASGAIDVTKRIVLVVEDLRDALISSRLASASYTTPLDAAGTRAAVGLTTANLDAQLADLPTAEDVVVAMNYLADTPANVWAYPTRTLTQSSTSTTDSTAAGSIARRRGDSWSISLTVGAITGYTSLWFTAKWDRNNTDAQAVLQIKLNASGLNDGLLYVNGAAATDDTLASITVSDASTGAIVIAVDETITDDLPPAGIYYDVQALVSGTVSTLDSGTLTISADVTRAVA